MLETLRRSPRRRHARALVVLVATLPCAVAVEALSQTSATPRLETPSPSALRAPHAAAPRAAIPTGVLSARGAARLARRGWWGRTYTTSSGESVTIRLSDSYPSDDVKGQQWAEFFASLVHGPELASLTAYIAPLEEVQRVCGGPDVLGCYGRNRIVTSGDAVHGITAATVATHEYGHHVAVNRLNSPWSAGEWGTKRWASYANVCARAAAGTAFPGDEGLNYQLNPGEAFAEAYRILNETRAGATSFDWEVVDRTFFPDTRALARVQEDVHTPWTRPSTRTVQGRFAGPERTWTLRLDTPLDGELAITLRVPRRPGWPGHELAVTAPGVRRALARGMWSSSGVKLLRYEICGRRSLVVRVTRSGSGSGRFTLRVTVP